MTTPLADELLLLAYDDSGKPSKNDVLDLGLAGAVLMELALAGRIDVVDKKVVVVDPAPTDDAVADHTLRRIADDGRARTPKAWLPRIKKGLRNQIAQRLVEQGVLRRERGRVLGVFPVMRLPAASGSTEANIRARLDSCVLRGADPDERTAALVALVHAVGLRRQAFPGSDRRRVDARMKQVGEGAWAADAVRRAIADIQASVVAAVVASSVAASAGANGN